MYVPVLLPVSMCTLSVQSVNKPLEALDIVVVLSLYLIAAAFRSLSAERVNIWLLL